MNKSLVGLLNPLTREPPRFQYDPFVHKVAGNGDNIRQVVDLNVYLREQKNRVPADEAPTSSARAAEGPRSSVTTASSTAEPMKPSEAEVVKPSEAEVDNCLQGTCEAGSAFTGSGADNSYRDSELERQHAAAQHASWLLGKRL